MRFQFRAFSVPLGALFAASLATPTLAQTQAEALTAAAVPPLNLSTQNSEAVRAAQAAQAGPGAAAVPAPAEAPESGTVSSDSPPRARVVASSEAAPLASPDFDPGEDSEGSPAVALGDNTVAGKVTVDNTPPAGGLLRSNPSLLGGATRSDLGVSAQF